MKTTAVIVTTKLNPNLDYPVSVLTARKHLYKQNIYGRAEIPKPLVPAVMPNVIYSGATTTIPGLLISGDIAFKNLT